jgi:hypothetical protein
VVFWPSLPFIVASLMMYSTLAIALVIAVIGSVSVLVDPLSQ